MYTETREMRWAKERRVKKEDKRREGECGQGMCVREGAVEALRTGCVEAGEMETYLSDRERKACAATQSGGIDLASGPVPAHPPTPAPRPMSGEAPNQHPPHPGQGHWGREEGH